MQYFSRLALSLLAGLMIATASPLQAAEATFSHQGVEADAKRYEAFLKTNWKSDGKKPADLKVEADKVFTGDARAAARLLANAVAADDKDSVGYFALAGANILLGNVALFAEAKYNIVQDDDEWRWQGSDTKQKNSLDGFAANIGLKFGF